MPNISFDWDPEKYRTNIVVHKVTFEEAQTVFWDDNARLIPDFAHSDSEDRFVVLGISSKGRMLTVCHCYRQNNETIRIISARKATKNEIKKYLHFNKGAQT